MFTKKQYEILRLIKDGPKSAEYIMDTLNMPVEEFEMCVTEKSFYSIIFNKGNLSDPKNLIILTGPEGIAEYESYERMMRSDDRSEEYNNIAIESNNIAVEANNIAKKANEKSDTANRNAKISNIIALTSLIIAIVSLVISLR